MSRTNFLQLLFDTLVVTRNWIRVRLVWPARPNFSASLILGLVGQTRMMLAVTPLTINCKPIFIS